MLAAQMNLRRVVAVGLLDGVVGPAPFAEGRLRDPEVLALGRRIDPYVHPALAAALADDVTAYINLLTRDGRRLSRIQPTYRGHPATPLSEDQLAGNGGLDKMLALYDLRMKSDGLVRT